MGKTIKNILEEFNGKKYNDWKDVTLEIKNELAKAGMPRVSSLAGGENTGWSGRVYKSSDFWVSDLYGFPTYKPNQLTFGVTISGKKAGLKYERKMMRFDSDEEEISQPVNPEKLFPKIKQVFEKLGLKVFNVNFSGAQMMWDDDCHYIIKTNWPDFLPPKPKK